MDKARTNTQVRHICIDRIEYEYVDDASMYYFV